MYYLLVNTKKVLSSHKYYWEMKNNLAQFTVLWALYDKISLKKYRKVMSNLKQCMEMK